MNARKETVVGVRGQIRDRGALERLTRSTLALTATFALGVAVVGCGGGVEGEEAGDEGPPAKIETRTQDLHSDAWRDWSSGMSADTAIDTDPSICSNQVGYFVTVRNSDQRYYVRRTVQQTNPAWKQFGTRQFASAPTCTMQQPYPGSSNKFLLAGKGTDNRVYVVEGLLPTATPGVSPPNPDWTGSWAEVSSTQYTGNNGRPALGSNGERVVLAFLNGSRVNARNQTLPYSGSGWSSPPAQSPVFPSGVAVSGIPAITYISGSTDKFVVMVRGVASGGSGLYWIHFNGTAFEGDWAQGFVPYAVDSDPAMDWDTTYDALTVYFKSGSDILQTSVTNPGSLGVRPFYAIPRGSGTAVLGAPRAVFGGGVEGMRAAAVRGYGPQTTQQNRGILLTETFSHASPLDP